MMHPSCRAIQARRHWALLALRAIAFLMILYGCVLLLRSLIAAFGMSRGGGSFFFQLIAVFYDEGVNPFWYGCSLILPGVALAFLSRTLARWIVPVVRHECPSCGYELQQLTAVRCPECGYELAADQNPPR